MSWLERMQSVMMGKVWLTLWRQAWEWGMENRKHGWALIPKTHWRSSVQMPKV